MDCSDKARTHTPKLIPLLVAALLSSPLTHATEEPVSTLTQAIEQTMLHNPDVRGSWYTFEAAREGRRVAKGGYFPKVDLIAERGHEKVETPLTRSNSYGHDSTRLTVTQMLFDGFATSNDVERADFAQRARYFEFKEAAEQAALEAAQAYIDVLRYQNLVTLTEENYVQHYNVYNQIQERVEAGISRSVDLEQANARLALAETNLITETANLHDVTARFQRIVGSLPAQQLTPMQMPTDSIPQNRVDAVNLSYEYSPILKAAVAGIRVAHAQLDATDSLMLPRLDLRLRKELEHDTDGIDGRFEEEAAELVLTYNLYNGGSDSALRRQRFNELDVAREQRIKDCRNVRQTTLIAFNDIQSLKRQMGFLERNRLAISKARNAYQKQFDIGQRTLLDLLDTENEYFESQRALLNAQNDLELAYARTLASLGWLTSILDTNGTLAKGNINHDLTSDYDGKITPCPVEVAPQQMVDSSTLIPELQDRRIRKDDNKLIYSMKVEFAHNSSDIRDTFNQDIKDGAALLMKYADVNAVIEGHTDSTGTDQYNQWLSERRANSVMEALTTQHGIDPNRLKAVGYGESRPIAENSTAEGRSHNRRVEMVIEYQEMENSSVQQ